MNGVGNLTKSKLDIARELNHAKIDSTGDSKLAEIAEKQERERLLVFVKNQEKEIAALRSELLMLRRKDGTQALPYIPPAQGAQGATIFPPIPSASGKNSGKLNGKF